ncbi:ABC transporter ATP-binding protein [Halomonas sp. WWR20]
MLAESSTGNDHKPLLQVENLECRYGTSVVVQETSFALAQGEIGCLLGPSGSGKTTLLRAIAGFEPLCRGAIRLAGQTLSSSAIQVPPEKRHVGMVFQDYALFPHLSVADNIAFGLQRHTASTRHSQIAELVGLMGLDQFVGRYPHELSGGQQQRVALARALAPQPRLLLLDEPFSNLDAELRRQLSQEVRQLLKRLGITAIMVTHDQQEAFTMSDRIGILHAGRLAQWAKPQHLYQTPATRFVARFIGQGFFLPGVMATHDSVITEFGIIAVQHTQACAPQSPVDVLLRPENIVQDSNSAILATVEQSTFAGATTYYRLRLPSSCLIEASFDNREVFACGERIPIRLEKAHKPVVFKR